MPKSEYRVVWEIDIFNARSPREAAEKALEIMADPGDALVFTVDGEEIDLAIAEEA